MTHMMSSAQNAAFAVLPQNSPVCLHIFTDAALEGAKGLQRTTHCLLQGIGREEVSAKLYQRFFFRSPADALNAMKLWKQQPIKSAVVSHPAPLPARIVLRAIGTLFRLIPFKPIFEPIPDSYFSGAANPSKQQYEELERFSKKNTGAIWMINFNQLHTQAQYPDKSIQRTGKAAYGLYAKQVLKMICSQGGAIDWLGDYAFTAIGNEGRPDPDRWHEIALVRYPSLGSFHRMITSSRYHAAVPHRQAALAAASLIVSASDPLHRNGPGE
jgi:uncharacterized protein (DUF1330 family)